jgi:hypothetical protein
MPGERGLPRGPMDEVESPTPVAIGYCPRCGENARATTTVRGVYHCPECLYLWYDNRIGQQRFTAEDFFSTQAQDDG